MDLLMVRWPDVAGDEVGLVLAAAANVAVAVAVSSRAPRCPDAGVAVMSTVR